MEGGVSALSQIPGFYNMGLEERLGLVRERAGLTEEDVAALRKGLELPAAERMVENVVGLIQIPVGIATNFRINGRDVLIPMATEEPSVVAAASHAAKLALPDGFFTSSTRPIMRGQIHIVGANEGAAGRILEKKGELIEQANRLAGSLSSLGGGVLDLAVRETCAGDLVVEVYVDCRDAMGANAIDRIAEGIAPEIEGLSGGRALLKILSNLATERIASARVAFAEGRIGGDVAEGVAKACEIAMCDPYRAVTHNKGIMNGVTAVVLATANDTRAVEAGAHAYASLSGRYLPLSRWRREGGSLIGELEMPLAVGIIGGATRSHPVAQACLKILGVRSASELAEVACAVGLAQNFAALRALVTEGIQKGHMELHARNVAIMAGATGSRIDAVAEALIREKDVRVARAREILGKT